MKLKRLMPILLFLLSLVQSGFTGSDTLIYKIIPQQNDLEDWQETSSEIYLGDDLFFLINGGAELYFEFGFEEVASINYQKAKSDTAVYVEVYKMISPDAAFGIYSLFANELNKNSNGAFVQCEGNHCFYYKDDFFILFRKQKNSPDKHLQYFIEEFDRKIKFTNEVSNWLINSIIKNKQAYPEFFLINGPIALNNHYYFSGEDIFGFDSGVVLKNKKETKIIFNYSSPNEVSEAFEKFVEYASNENKFEQSANEFSFIDTKGYFLSFKLKEKFLEIIISKSDHKKD